MGRKLDFINSAEEFFETRARECFRANHLNSANRLNTQEIISESETSESSSQCSIPNTAAFRACVPVDPESVNKHSVIVREKLNSSTAVDFLDLPGNFLTVSDNTDMSGTEGQENVVENVSGDQLSSPLVHQNAGGQISSPVVHQNADTQLREEILATLGKIDKLTNEVKGLKDVLGTSIQRLVNVD